MKKLILLGLIALACSCENGNIDYNYPQEPKNIRNGRAGKFFGNRNFFEDKQNQFESKLDLKNSNIWLASIEVISDLIPIDFIDENSGLIKTKWYQDDENKNQNSRVKINLLVKGAEPKKENLVLTIFKQTKNKQNIWVDEPANNQTFLVQTIQNKILKQAQNNF